MVEPDHFTEPLPIFSLMSDGETLAWLGTSAVRWARAFMFLAPQTGPKNDRMMTMVTWFANAIGAGEMKINSDLYGTSRDAEKIEALCAEAHSAYEKTAAEVGWETNPLSRLPWDAIPEPNKLAMRAAVTRVVEMVRAV
jgi:hypothetical protein